MRLSDLNVGFDLRVDPRPPFALSVLLLLFAFAAVIIFCLAAIGSQNFTTYYRSPIGYLWAEGLPLSWSFQLTFALSLAAGLITGLTTFIVAYRGAPRREPFYSVKPDDPRLYCDDDARRALQSRFMADSGHGASGARDAKAPVYLAPNLAMPRAAELKGVMVAGAPQSGKSNIIRALADQFIERGDRVLLLCNKGDITQCFDANEAILIGAHHAHSYALDLGADVNNSAAAIQLASDIVPRSSPPFWSDTARTILTDIILQQMIEHGTNWNARTLLEACLTDSNSIQKAIAAIDLSAKPLLEGNEDGDDRTIAGVLITLRSAAYSKLRPLAWAWDNMPSQRRFSVRRWLADGYNGKRTVIVQLSAEYASVSSLVTGQVLRSIAIQMADPTLANDPGRRVALILDEFHSVDRIDGLPRALAIGREKGLVCIIGVQNPQQIIKTYGKGDGAILTDLFQIKIYGRQTGGETAKAISDGLGTRAISALVLNRTPAPNDQRRLIEDKRTIATFSPSRFANELGEHGTDKNRNFRALIHAYNQAYLLDWPATIWRKKRAGMVPAPWLDGVRQTVKPPTG